MTRSDDFEVHSVGGVPFQVTDLPAAVSWLERQISDGRGVSVRLANAYCVALAQKDRTYSDHLTSSGVNFPDGTPVVWAMRAQGQRRAGRVRGPSFFVCALEAQARARQRPFFLGASEETLELMTSRLRSEMPSLQVAGSYSPPYAPVTEEFIDACVEEIAPTSPDLVWVGLGTPKQDFVSTEIASRLGVPAIGVGAAFDFLAGTVREAPLFVQNSGLEWAFRLGSEPRRLWKRYLVGNVLFTVAVLKNWRGKERRTRA